MIAQQNNTYFVLTAKHLVATEDEYEIVTTDGQEYILDYGTVRKLPDVDLALVQFTSNENYPVAEIGDSDAATEGQPNYQITLHLPIRCQDQNLASAIVTNE